MYYVCIENNKVISILNYQPTVPNTVSVVEITDENYDKLKNQTHYFDISTRSLISVSTEELQKRQIEKENIEPREFLNSTDWMILRHLRQKTLGIPTSLSEQEFLELEQKRDHASTRIK